MNDRNSIRKTLSFRHACKEFNGSKISKEDFDLILEAGLFAPSSYGLEPTRMIVVRDERLKRDLQSICMNQKQISSASEVVVYKGLLGAFLTPSNYIDSMIRRKTGRDEMLYKTYKQNLEAKLQKFDDRALCAWSLKQTYLVAQAMMDMAAYLRIDSCAIEGFDKKELEEYFKLDTFKEQISLIVAFGYRKGEQPNKIRLDINEVVQFM